MLILDVDGQYLWLTICRSLSGALVLWEFRPLSNPDRSCWHRAYRPVDRCINTAQGCEPEVPIS